MVIRNSSLATAARLLMFAFALQAVPTSALSCIFREWTFKELREEADVVVIAKPISVINTGVVTPLPGRIYTAADGKRIQLRGAETRVRFKVLDVLKGNVGTEFTLSLQKQLEAKTPSGKIVPDMCPVPYREFDTRKEEHYLMFLQQNSKKELAILPDQYNVFVSIIKLEGGPRLH